jgi:uncharacterized protein
MSPRLPEFVDPWRSADLQKCFSGQLALSVFPRLGSSLTRSKGMVQYSIEFKRVTRRRIAISGMLVSQLNIECQRCMGSMEYPLDVSFELIVTAGPEEAKLLPDDVDSLVVFEEEGVNPLEILEDELILALPLVAMHELEACEVEPEVIAVGDETVVEPKDSEKESPFAVLAQLKSNLKQPN